MQITTFYSYKGGVGRTLACANFGLYLAKTGRKVVLADMDFEAPGLDSKFADVSVSEIEGGLLDQFLAFQANTDIPKIQAIDLALPRDVAEAGGSRGRNRLRHLPVKWQLMCWNAGSTTCVSER